MSTKGAKKVEMSAWQSTQQPFPFPSISKIKEEIEEAERTMIRPEENFLSEEIRELRREVENLKKESDSLKTLHGLAEFEKISVEEKLKEREVECKELTEKVNRLIEAHRSAIDGKIRAKKKYRKAMEETERVKIEGKKNIEELLRKNKELEERISRDGDNQRRLAVECEDLSERMNTLVEEHNLTKENYRKALQETKRAESEAKKKMEDLLEKNGELEERIRVYEDNDKRKLEKGTDEAPESAAYQKRKSRSLEGEGPSEKNQNLFEELEGWTLFRKWFMDMNSFQVVYYKLMPDCEMIKKDEGAAFWIRAYKMQKCRDPLSLYQVCQEADKVRDLIIAKYGVLIHELIDKVYFYALWGFCVGYAKGLNDVKENHPSVDLSNFSLFNPNLDKESQLEIMMGKFLVRFPEAE